MKKAPAKTNLGQTLVEILLATTIFSFILTLFLSALSNLISNQVKYAHQVQATQFAREGMEVIYNIAVNSGDWDTFYNRDFSKSYKLVLMSDEYNLGSIQQDGQDTGKFHREIYFHEVWRDPASGEIVEDLVANPDATVDEYVVKVTSSVTWTEKGKPQSIELNTYLVNL